MRTTVSKSDLAKAAEFLKKLGLSPVAVDVLPGKVRIEFAGEDTLTLPDQFEEMERRKERWGASGTEN